MKYTYNYTFEKKDNRDFKFKNLSKPLLNIPLYFNISNLPDVLNQGSLGSCTAQAVSNALRHCLKKEKPQYPEIIDFQPSRLYIYYYSRFLANTVNEDSGAVIRDVMKAISKYGACSSEYWPYIISKFTIKPPAICLKKGRDHIKGLIYLYLNQNEKELKSAIFKGYPIICGIKIFESFESEESLSTGDVQMPNGQFFGGHCILLVGYNDLTKRFTFQNSWGIDVGNKGYFTIPYEYILNSDYASDFWTIEFFK